MAVPKVDFKRTLDGYQARHGVFTDLTLTPRRYLAVDGHGDPNGPGEYRSAIETLYPIAYRLKFASKNDLGRDYVVPPLEAQWWADDMALFTARRDKSTWNWTALLFTPDWVSDEMFDQVVAEAASPAHPALPALERLALRTIDEGRCIQTLHVGSYDDEGPVLAELHDVVIPERGLTMTGKHHEIYLSDPRRVESSRLRTILRQPVASICGR